VTKYIEYSRAYFALQDGWDLAEQLYCDMSMEVAVVAYDKLCISPLVYKHSMAAPRAVLRNNDSSSELPIEFQVTI
jgi:hypothetical protein